MRRTAIIASLALAAAATAASADTHKKAARAASVDSVIADHMAAGGETLEAAHTVATACSDRV